MTEQAAQHLYEVYVIEAIPLEPDYDRTTTPEVRDHTWKDRADSPAAAKAKAVDAWRSKHPDAEDVQLVVRFVGPNVCPQCKGEGRVAADARKGFPDDGMMDCPDCHGTGLRT
jgi:hypothetical protein